MARHLAPFWCRQTMAEIVRRRSWGGLLPLGRHVSISGSRSIHAPSVSIAPSSFQEEQNARHHKQFKLEQALDLIAATTTTSGLIVDCVLDPRRYAKGIKVRDQEMACLNIQGDEFHPEWNYTIAPRGPQHPTCSPYLCVCPYFEDLPPPPPAPVYLLP